MPINRAFQTEKKKSAGAFVLRIIHVFAIEGHDVVEHTLGLDSRTVGVKLYGLDIAVDGLVPFGFFTKGVSLFVPFLCGSKLYTLHSTLSTLYFYL